MEKKGQKILNKKTASILLVLLILAIAANIYSKKREAREAGEGETTATEEALEADTGNGERDTKSYHIKLDDFTIGEETISSKPKYQKSGKTDDESEITGEQPEKISLDKEKALSVAARLEEVMQEAGLSAILGSEFSGLEHLFVKDSTALEALKQNYETAVEKYIYRDGNGLMKIDFTDVWAEVKVADEDAMVIDVSLEYNYCAKFSRQNKETNTLESYDKEESGITKAEFQWEDNGWKVFSLQ